MKQIKFRYKNIVTNEILGYEWLDEAGWHHYFLDIDTITDKNSKHVYSGVFDKYPVKREQFTTFTDINETKLYINDLIEFEDQIYQIYFNFGEYRATKRPPNGESVTLFDIVYNCKLVP